MGTQEIIAYILVAIAAVFLTKRKAVLEALIATADTK